MPEPTAIRDALCRELDAVLGSGPAALLKLHNMVANLPACLDLDRADSPWNLATRALDRLAKAEEQLLCPFAVVYRLVEQLDHLPYILRSPARRIVGA